MQVQRFKNDNLPDDGTIYYAVNDEDGTYMQGVEDEEQQYQYATEEPMEQDNQEWETSQENLEEQEEQLVKCQDFSVQNELLYINKLY